MEEFYFNTKEAAVLLKLKPDSVRKLCNDGTIKATKKPGGGWLLTQKNIDEYLGKPSTTVGDSKEVATAKERAEVSKAEADVAKSNKEKMAYTLGYDSVEDYRAAERKLMADIENQDKIVAEAIKEAEERLASETHKVTLAIEAHQEKAERYEPENVKLRDLAKLQNTRIKELEELVGIKEAEEALALDNATHFETHLEAGCLILKRASKYISLVHPSLSKYLARQAAGLAVVTDSEFGISCFRACMNSLIKVAILFEDTDNKIPDSDKIYQKLGDFYTQIETTMRVPDDRGNESEIYTPLRPEQQPIMDKIKDKVGA